MCSRHLRNAFCTVRSCTATHSRECPSERILSIVQRITAPSCRSKTSSSLVLDRKSPRLRIWSNLIVISSPSSNLVSSRRSAEVQSFLGMRKICVRDSRHWTPKAKLMCWRKAEARTSGRWSSDSHQKHASTPRCCSPARLPRLNAQLELWKGELQQKHN